MKVKHLFILLGVISLSLSLCSCKNGEPNTKKLESLKFKQSSYTIEENNLDLNLRKELVGTPAGITETAKIEWTLSKPDLAEMSGSYLTPKIPGTLDVTATIQGLSATCSITITEVHISGATLDNLSVALNGTAKLVINTEPSGISIERFTLSSSNSSVATVDPDGTVHGIKEGTAKIKAVNGDVTAECTVTVKKVLVKSIILSQTEARFYKEGETLQLTATVEPSDASMPEITWKSSNSASVSVSSNGLVKGVKYFNSTPVKITATADNVTATCLVTLWPQQSESITLNETFHKFNRVGDSFTLKITDIKPALRTLPDKFDWYKGSSVSEQGTQKGVCTINGGEDVLNTSVKEVTIACTGIGTDKVIVYDRWSEVVAVCTVTMPAVPATGITLNKSSVTITGDNATAKLVATLTPLNSTSNVTWSSKYNSIATVSADGTVTAHNTGETVITATADGVKAECTVKVTITGTMSDRNGRSYKTVKLCNKWWMAENLQCVRYDTQSECSGEIPTSATASYAYYYVDGKNVVTSYTGKLTPSLREKLGFLYNWAAAVGLKDEASAKAQTTAFAGNWQGICPNGWHLPTRNEWIDVSRVYIGSEGYYYQLYAVDMMTTTGWYTEKGKDKVGFAVLPAGYAAGSSKFYKVGEEACFWCATPDNAFQSDYVRLNTSDSYPKYEVFSKDRAMSVRCVKN